MKTSNLLITSLIALSTSSAFALDLSANVYPTSYLGPKSNIATKATYAANAGAFMCQFAGKFDVAGVSYSYSGHSMFNPDGIQDANGFGHYLSPTGKESFMHVSVVNPTGAVSCVQKLDITTSKYAVNKYGVGVSEIHWLADPANPTGCPSQTDQMGYVSDKSGNSFHTKFISAPSPTNVPADQTVSCMKTGL